MKCKLTYVLSTNSCLKSKLLLGFTIHVVPIEVCMIYKMYIAISIIDTRSPHRFGHWIKEPWCRDLLLLL